jgi:hypothetical protein
MAFFHFSLAKSGAFFQRKVKAKSEISFTEKSSTPVDGLIII